VIRKWRPAPPRLAKARRFTKRRGGSLASCTAGALLALLHAVAPATAEAQTLVPKRAELSIADPGACPPPPAHSAVPLSLSSSTDSLLVAGSQAAILGDQHMAADLLRAAAASDPGSAVVAYRLARTLDELGSGREAMLEYCRYLALVPAAPDRRRRGAARAVGP
jgi:hypothetical protein